MKQIIRLTESDLHRIIKNSVKRILREQRFNVEKDGSVSNDKGKLVYSPKLPDSCYKKRNDDGNTPFGKEPKKKVNESMLNELPYPPCRKGTPEYREWVLKTFTPLTTMYWHAKYPDWTDEQCEKAADEELERIRQENQ